jgi:molybdate transport system substrate-binding protein
VTSTSGSELRLIAGGSLAGLFKELGPLFEKASGHSLSIHFDATPNIVSRINTDTPFDAVVVPIDVFRDAAAKERLTNPIEIARVGYGVIVRAGAAKPDLSTADAFRKALLAASSVASVPASAAGAYVTRVYERLGIADEMKTKTRVEALPMAIAPSVAKGEAELGIFLTNVFNAPGIELAGPFPADLQQELVFAAAIAKNATAGSAAKALLEFLKTPPAVAAIKAAGMIPAPHTN